MNRVFVAGVVPPLAGIYGMDFADSPYNMLELGWTFGYPAVMVGMARVGVALLVHFRHRGYL